ncbi:ATP-binding cassette domain-containing protein [Novosphingobium sp. 1949]|uniref:ATP-binding cassette domain-containing protein n=1 Tax=Novosphingobium organovorum TaxID=2930092 RepID=A0ABT0BHT9_9SPHN|nr:ATP-binding cassette domain-containing protein [Novosphingobium organovorum]MCJ2184633.1 ATP-binding cassette domain-containing protein [Novosphingobium organovorum]
MDCAVGDRGAPGNPCEAVGGFDHGVAASRPARPLAIEARALVKRFDGTTAVDGVDLAVPEGSVYGILGPNGAGKTTTLRMLLGIIDPDSGLRRILGSERPHEVAHAIGYLPEERGLYPAMKAVEAIAFLGALRGLPLKEGRRRGRELLERHGLGYAADRQIRQLSKGMAQQVQILGTLVHRPRLVIFDEPFSGLDALNQGKLERMMRDLAKEGTTVIFSTHVIAHAERLCDEVAIIAGGKVPFAGPVDVARDRIPAQVRLETRAQDGPWRAALPPDARCEGHFWYFPLPESGIEALLRALIAGEAGILSLSVERAGLHDAFVSIAGEAAARAMVDTAPADGEVRA